MSDVMKKFSVANALAYLHQSISGEKKVLMLTEGVNVIKLFLYQ